MSQVNYQPLGAGVLVQPISVSKTTESGIVKSESMIKQEQSDNDYTTEVLAVGPDVRGIEIGNTVVLGNGANCMPIKINDKEYWQVDSYQIMGIMH
jgi:co-chaperonin GroES (HSP10)